MPRGASSVSRLCSCSWWGASDDPPTRSAGRHRHLTCCPAIHVRRRFPGGVPALAELARPAWLTVGCTPASLRTKRRNRNRRSTWDEPSGVGSRRRSSAKERIMSKTGTILGALLVTVALATVANAGGRARVALSNLPDKVTAGQSFDVAITVIPESWRHRRNVRPIVTAECGDRKIVTTAVALKADNRYQASLKLPSAGRWKLRVDSQY